ncbi:MAG: ECF-type sigma factor [Dokdonella sp.]
MSLPADPEQLSASTSEELKPLAHAQLAGRAPRSRCTTALVHEVYIELIHSDAGIQDGQHFVSLAVRARRQILADVARRKTAANRGGGAATVILDAGRRDPTAFSVDLHALARAIDRLCDVHERLSTAVELHFHRGHSFNHVAQPIGITERTEQRAWTEARALLERNLGTTQ